MQSVIFMINLTNDHILYSNLPYFSGIACLQTLPCPYWCWPRRKQDLLLYYSLDNIVDLISLSDFFSHDEWLWQIKSFSFEQMVSDLHVVHSLARFLENPKLKRIVLVGFRVFKLALKLNDDNFISDLFSLGRHDLNRLDD